MEGGSIACVEGGKVAGTSTSVAWLAVGVEGGELPVCCDMMIVAWCDLNESEGWVAKKWWLLYFGM